MSVREQIEREIGESGPMPFSRYMQICLYEPFHGYYSAHAEQFGKAGDFYTSSDVHAVFGRLLARQFDEIWQALDRPAAIEILELGPGRSLFARDVLDRCKQRFPDFFAALTYTAQESSPALGAKLGDNLREHLDIGKATVSDEGPILAERRSASAEIRRALSVEAPLIVFANEFLDALPVEILSTHGKLHLVLENNRLREIWLPPRAEELEFIDRYGVHPEAGERIEVPFLEWIRQIASSITRGLLLIFDHGYTCNEQLAGRYRGTLMASRHHSASSDPYQAPGEQDLTAHVNFTALASGCADTGMRVEQLRTQSQFLMGIGERNRFADAFEQCRIPQERAKVALQLKHLVSPVGVGETFKVLMASRAMGPETIAGLGGLSFGSGLSAIGSR